jgi:hypothetical protein
MTGLVRLQRLVMQSGRLHAIAAFTGELFDADGTRVGVGSRRVVVPAEMARSLTGISVFIGPMDVDLLGLAVSVEALSIELGPAVPAVGGDAEPRTKSIPS